MMRHRHGFTVVELMMVVAVIAILATIVTTAATAAVRQARSRRASAASRLLEAGFAAYQMDQEKWPDKIEEELDDPGSANSATLRFLSFKDACSCFQQLAKESLKAAASGKAYLDLSDIVICSVGVAEKPKASGMTFRDAIKKGSTSSLKVSSSSMNVAFGYLDPSTGYFRPFHIAVNVKTGTPIVTKCCKKCYNEVDGGCDNQGCRECHDPR